MKILLISFMATTFIFGLGILSILLLIGNIVFLEIKGNSS